MVNAAKYFAYAARQESGQPRKLDFLLFRYSNIMKEEAAVKKEVRDGLLGERVQKLPSVSSFYHKAEANIPSLPDSRRKIRRATLDKAYEDAYAYALGEKIAGLGQEERLSLVAREILKAEAFFANDGKALERNKATINGIAKNWLSGITEGKFNILLEFGRTMLNKDIKKEEKQSALLAVALMAPMLGGMEKAFSDLAKLGGLSYEGARDLVSPNM
ncbi:MAG: hypothetical protein NTX79_02440 [Candidatus Micrarchaeota archaeon]|nr:hypothetical protein [Candidatus Micrarchaeota archaeon]